MGGLPGKSSSKRRKNMGVGWIVHEVGSSGVGVGLPASGWGWEGKKEEAYYLS